MDINSEDTSNRNLSRDSIIYSPLTVLLFLALLTIFTILLNTGLRLLIEQYYGANVQEVLTTLSPESPASLRNFIRFNMALGHLFIFIIPALCVAIFFFRNDWRNFLQLKFQSFQRDFFNGFIGVLLIVGAFPLAHFTLWLNKQIPLPDWVKTIEESASSTIQNLMVTENYYELILNLVVFAIIPAFGEELLFRGIIQRTFEKWFGNPNAAIWLAAFLFSAFHMQFEGFLPRMLLGAILGYLMYWSKNLWIPILAHFVYNGFQIVSAYLYSHKLSTMDIEQIEKVPAAFTVFSTIFVLGLSYYLIRFNKKMDDTASANITSEPVKI